jgi:carboxyl-terminal processing protease
VTDPSLKKVTDGAVRGLLEALDPYSTYFTPQEYQEYLEHPVPGPGNVGVFVSKRLGYVTVVSILPGGPAEKAGIKVGDLIDLVENTSTRDLSVVQIQRLLAGAPGTTVTLAVVHEPRVEPQKIVLTRAVLFYPPSVAKKLDDGAGYIRVARFNKGRADEISAKLKELTSSGADKIVLDLRNCAGGEVQEAVDTASLFMDRGLVAYLQGLHFPREDLVVKPSGPVSKLPLALLINQSTVGPAELVAAAILGNKRGDVVGVRSFGVGVYQKAIPVGDGSALLLSVAKYYGPDGKAIQDNGVTPNVIESGAGETASLDEDNELQQPERFGGQDDPQLRRALEILRQRSSPAKAA